MIARGFGTTVLDTSGKGSRGPGSLASTIMGPFPIAARVQGTDSSVQPADPPCNELARFLETRSRSIEDYSIEPNFETIVVTGGTGCIGRVLLSQLKRICEARLVSIARRPPLDSLRVSGVTYLCADVRDLDSMRSILGEHRPEFLIHLAAERDPGLAEQTVFDTISINVGGTISVMQAAADMQVPLVSTASSGKVVRFFGSDVYAATKGVAEYVVSRAAERFGIAATCARFTHVVDNSIVFSRLLRWSQNGQPVRLHGANVGFYAQSALECAQLLMIGSIAPFRSSAGVLALRNLGWPPISLRDLARDVVKSSGSTSSIEVVGFEPGYEEQIHPATYDPVTAGDISPLMNALEAARASGVAPFASSVDGVPLLGSSMSVDDALAELISAIASSADETTLRRSLSSVSKEIFLFGLRRADPQDAYRLAIRASGVPVLAHDHVVISDILESWLRATAKQHTDSARRTG